ncbi:hypothetical protein IG631_02057 [Alternaria alternata]|jgi:hypothetical protein|nr:hypothetical protein IG631_02057 [Alternaria alternata]
MFSSSHNSARTCMYSSGGKFAPHPSSLGAGLDAEPWGFRCHTSGIHEKQQKASSYSTIRNLSAFTRACVTPDLRCTRATHRDRGSSRRPKALGSSPAEFVLLLDDDGSTLRESGVSGVGVSTRRGGLPQACSFQVPDACGCTHGETT